MGTQQQWSLNEYMEFRGRVAGLEYALWDWSRSRPQARFIHPSLGDETAAFCVTKALSSFQTLWSLYYRAHSWLLGLGTSLDSILTEIAGVPTSPLHGRAGSMHLLLHSNIIDCNSIVGAQIPIAVGAAIANREQGVQTVCVLGDGATNTGVFYEALNIAALFRAPILFVVEDNHVAMDTAFEQTSSATIEAKFLLFSIPFFSTSADDVDAVLGCVVEASNAALSGPVAISIASQRIGAHVLSSQGTWDKVAEAYGTSTTEKKAMESTYSKSLAILHRLEQGSPKEEI